MHVKKEVVWFQIFSMMILMVLHIFKMPEAKKSSKLQNFINIRQKKNLCTREQKSEILSVIDVIY